MRNLCPDTFSVEKIDNYIGGYKAPGPETVKRVHLQNF